MSSNREPTVAVKLFIDKEKSRVLFAESDKDFVDILFGFLTLPLGTIVRLLGKQSQIGCLDKLYKSVESLSADHFQTKACKTMLLSPVNAAAALCDRLKVKIDGTDQTAIYVCSVCSSRERRFSTVGGVICDFGHCMTGTMTFPVTVIGGNGDEIFVKSGPKFITTDDLQVAPSSTALMFSLIEKFGLHEVNIEEKVIQLNSGKMTSLLRRALLSKQPLTGLYFDVAVAPNATNVYHFTENVLTKLAGEAEPKFEDIKARLVQTKDESSVLYAEVGPDFVDLLVGLLSIALGSIIKAYGQCSPNGCVDNIYKSVDGSAMGCVKQEYRSLLKSPKLAPFFGCSSNVLKVEESAPRNWNMNSLYELNPKCPLTLRGCTVKTYIKGGPINFMVTDDLQILHFSLANSLQALRASKVPKGKLVDKELTLNKTQVLELLRAAIVTQRALSSVLLPPKK